MKTSHSRSLFYLIVPRDGKQLNLPLLGESKVSYVGQKAVNNVTLPRVPSTNFAKKTSLVIVSKISLENPIGKVKFPVNNWNIIFFYHCYLWLSKILNIIFFYHCYLWLSKILNIILFYHCYPWLSKIINIIFFYHCYLWLSKILNIIFFYHCYLC